jgi:putative PIN family toxin of toxin-antitoxin system
MIRAVVDLNVIISGIIVPRGFAFYVWSAWLARQFTLVISEGMLLELMGKLAAPRISTRYGITTQESHDVNRLLRSRGFLVSIPAHDIERVTGDPEDDLVLATARLGMVDYLVTRDRGLLQLSHYGDVEIVEPLHFLRVLPAPDSERSP